MSIWEKSSAWIRAKLNPESFDSWFAPISCESFEDDVLLLQVPNKFFKDWLLDNYSDLIKEALLVETGRQVTLKLVISGDGENGPRLPLPETTGSSIGTLERLPIPVLKLNKKYTYDTFVVGKSNKFAYGASRAVSQSLGTKYNPLFVYGGVGLGKTHLLHAIGNSIREGYPHHHLCYISSEQFMNEFVQAIKTDKMDAFHRYFRKEVDVLLIDDIQFIAGKDRTQDEFFHTFNHLYDNNKQVILASDKYPQEIPDLEERLCSRFQWGLITDIQPPEFETRLTIVTQKAKEEEIALPEDVAQFLATFIKSNVRELEGALINLAAHASLDERLIDLGFAQEMLKKIITVQQSAITVEGIQSTVCKHFSISIDDLKSSKRQRTVAFPRQVAMFLCRKALNTSFPELGQQFGGKDHTTVMAACKKIERLMTEDVDLRSRIESLERLLGF